MKRANFFTNQQYNIFSKNLIRTINTFSEKGIWAHETTNQLYVLDMFQNNRKFITLVPINTNLYMNETRYGIDIPYTLDIPYDVILDPYTLDLITNLDQTQ
jgi:hypothetical protein